MSNCIPLAPTNGSGESGWKAEGSGVTHEIECAPMNYDCLHHGTPEVCTNYMVPDPTATYTDKD